jgi:hypothetical protein
LNLTGLGTLNFTAFRVSKGWNVTEYGGKTDDDTDYTMLVVGLIAGCAGLIVLFSVMLWWRKRSSSSGVGDGDDYDAGYVPMGDEDAVVIQ